MAGAPTAYMGRGDGAWSQGGPVSRIAALVLLLAAIAAAGPALAQQGPPPGRPGQRMGPPPGRPMPPAREASFGGRPPAGPAAPHDRMTPDERRQLRQDIHQHGQEVYHPQQGNERPQQ
jgi:hypothetical protein